jgi:hypothetical protein
LCNFEVDVLANPSRDQLEKRMFDFFRTADADLLLFYYCGHGIVDEHDDFFLATTETQRDSLPVTSVSASFIHKVSIRGKSPDQLLVLDCCFGGAVLPGGRSDRRGEGIDVTSKIKVGYSPGSNISYITSSGAIERSYEVGSREVPDEYAGIFTKHLVAGIETGEADLNRDGVITAQEIFEYTSLQTSDEARRRKGLGQTPKIASPKGLPSSIVVGTANHERGGERDQGTPPAAATRISKPNDELVVEAVSGILLDWKGRSRRYKVGNVEAGPFASVRHGIGHGERVIAQWKSRYFRILYTTWGFRFAALSLKRFYVPYADVPEYTLNLVHRVKQASSDYSSDIDYYCLHMDGLVGFGSPVVRKSDGEMIVQQYKDIKGKLSMFF